MALLTVTAVIKGCDVLLEDVLDCLRKYDKLDMYIIMCYAENVYVYYTRDLDQTNRPPWTDRIFKYKRHEYDGFETVHLSDKQGFMAHVSKI